MDEKKDFYRSVEEMCAKEPRFKPDAYEFVMQALAFTQEKLKKKTHVSGRELLEGIRELIIEQYGPMAKVVLAHWGITKTDDFGTIVFTMIEQGILSKTEQDSREHFKEVYDFEAAFGNAVMNYDIKEGS